MSLIKSCPIHNTVYYKQCSECLHEIAKAEKSEIKANSKKEADLKKAKLRSQAPKVKPKQVSQQRKGENETYNERRPIFLKGKKCAVFPELDAVQVHHMAGRRGYVDQWAYDNKISAFLDERYWLAVSEPGHIKIEADTVWAKDMGFSIVRSIPIKNTI